jgi:hypothetical protein
VSWLLALLAAGAMIAQASGDGLADPHSSREPDWYVPDPVVGFVHRPSARRHFAWPEHPRGFVDLVTNDLGLREDRPTSLKKTAAVRILVTGDSQIDGVVFNSESFPHRLESRLNGKGRTYEVLNAATGHFGFQHYPAMLRKYLAYKPDVFIVVAYMGNDFGDVLELLPNLAKQRPSGYWEPLKSAFKPDDPVLGQALNQDYFYARVPEARAPALDVAEDKLKQAAELCAANGIRFYVVLLPSKAEAEPATDQARIDSTLKTLKLSPEALKVNTDLRIELASRLKARGFAVLDAFEALSKQPRPMFWKQDYHLNVDGHDRLAGAFYERYGRELESLPRP